MSRLFLSRNIEGENGRAGLGIQWRTMAATQRRDPPELHLAIGARLVRGRTDRGRRGRRRHPREGGGARH
eukprot:COSAG06_NODE_48739_length_330_cov_0.632035_1_plen_69_part_10